MSSHASPTRLDLRRLLGGSAFIFGCRLLGAGIGFLTQVLLARWMGAAGLGAYVLAYSWLVVLTALAMSGYNGAAVRFIGEGLAIGDQGLIRGFVRHAVGWVLGASVACATVAGLALALVGDQTAAEPVVFFIALAGVPVFALLKLNVGLANAYSRFALGFLPADVIRPAAFVIAAWLFYRQLEGLTPELAMAIQLGVLLSVLAVQSIAIRWLLFRDLSAHAHRSESGLWRRTAMQLLLLALFTNYLSEYTIIVIGFFLPADEIAIYNAAFRVALLIQFGLTAVDAFTAPQMVRHHSTGNRTELAHVVRHSTRLRFWAALAAVLGYALVGKPLLGLFGSEFVAGYPLLLILAIGQLSQAAVGPAARLLMLTGLQTQGLTVSAMALILCTIMLFTLVPVFGVTGAAVAASLSIGAWSYALRVSVKKHLGLDPWIFARNPLT